MRKDSPFVITISRQLGSGGAYLGHRLATRLNILYLDREILYQAAQRLKISEIELDSREEKLTSRWDSLLHTMAHAFAPEYAPPTHQDLPTDEMLYKVESEIITHTSEARSAVIVGRAGSHVLRQLPEHLSIFLYADTVFRQQRVQEAYHVSPQDALKLIDRIDRERTRYLRVFTGKDWMNACQYHLCIDTGAVGLDAAEDIILAALQARLGNLNI